MYNFDVITIIMTGFGGLTVLGVTQVLKEFLHAKGAAAVLVSIVVSAGFTGYYLLAVSPPFTFISFVGYTILVCLTANGIFRGLHTPTNPQ